MVSSPPDFPRTPLKSHHKIPQDFTAKIWGIFSLSAIGSLLCDVKGHWRWGWNAHLSLGKELWRHSAGLRSSVGRLASYWLATREGDSARLWLAEASEGNIG